MYLGQISHYDEGTPLADVLRRIFEFVGSHDFDQLPSGRIDIDGDDLYIMNNRSTLVAADERRLEVHRRYIDVQMPLDGAEVVGWKAASELTTFVGDYDPQADIRFSAERPQCFIEMRPGQFGIFTPADAHAPAIGSGSLHKLVAKIRIAD